MSEKRITEIFETLILPSGLALGTVTWEQLYIREGWAYSYEAVEGAATNYTIAVPNSDKVSRFILEPVLIDSTSTITLYENPTVGGTGGTVTTLRNLNRDIGTDNSESIFTKGTTAAITFTGGTTLSAHASSFFTGDTGGRFWYLKKGTTYGLSLSAATTISFLIYEIEGK